MIKLNKYHKAFSGIKFCAQAVAKRTPDHPTNYLHIEEGIIEATNGHILNQFKYDGMEDGFYEVVKNTKTEIWLEKNKNLMSFPNTASVVPTGKAKQTLELTLNSEKEYLSVPYAQIIRALPKENTINYDLFIKLDGHGYTCSIYGKDTPVMFKNEVLTSLIMPLRMG